MNHELQSEAIDLIVSAIDKQRGNYEAAARSVKEQMDRKFGFVCLKATTRDACVTHILISCYYLHSCHVVYS